MQKNIIFQTCTKTPKSICSEYLVLLLILCKQLKILQCEMFPEFIILPLDTESHSFSICLRRPNHTIYVMRVWCILTCINCKWKTKRICIHLICFKYENRASPFLSCSGFIDYKMFQLLKTSNENAWKKTPLFRTSSESSVHRLKTPQVWEALTNDYLLFKGREQQQFL